MFQRIGAAAYKNDLTNTLELCEGLGNPQQKFKTIHIAGTNGKGSTSHALASIFQEHGYKTGLYTSPHLVDFRERIRINGQFIPKQAVIDFVEKHQNLIEGINLSFFEATVGMAFDYFANEGVDIAIIETGLGGRLDSTNIITPILSVITNISFDHMDMLGDTLEKIAFEKAGIIKTKVPVIIGETQNEVKDVFLKKAEQSDSEISFADTNPHYFNTEIQSDLKGDFQQKNLKTVLQAIETLNKQGYSFSNFKIATALNHVKKNTGLKGRWEVLEEAPFIVADTGHNEAGLRLSMQELSKIKYEKLYMVFGVVKEKTTENLWSFLPKNAYYLFCKPSIPRGRDAQSLYVEAVNNGFIGSTFSSVELAFKQALAMANKEDAIFIGGSTFIVADYFSFKESIKD
jgi:dihydrofolate synthase/folylpolyglutamate synthase